VRKGTKFGVLISAPNQEGLLETSFRYKLWKKPSWFFNIIRTPTWVKTHNCTGTNDQGSVVH